MREEETEEEREGADGGDSNAQRVDLLLRSHGLLEEGHHEVLDEDAAP